MPDNQQPAAPQPDESFLHSLASSAGIDPEAVLATAKAIRQHPWQVAKEVGSAQAGEFVDAGHHLRDTALSALNGVASAITNPEAKATAIARLKSPGLINKIQGAEEYATAAVPLVGGNYVKAEEQADRGNIAGSIGTTLGTTLPLVTDTEGAEGIKAHLAETGKTFVDSAKEGLQRAAVATAPEGSAEAGFAKIPGSKKVRSAPAARLKAEIPEEGEIPQNDAAGFIDPQGKFISFPAGVTSHEQLATQLGTSTESMVQNGHVRKVGQGSYQTGTLNPHTVRAIENDIIQDSPSLTGKYPVNVVIGTPQGEHEFSAEDFIHKYNGDLNKAMRATGPVAEPAEDKLAAIPGAKLVGKTPEPPAQIEIQAKGPAGNRHHIATIDGEPVGSVGYATEPSGVARTFGQYVQEEHRGKGIAPQLIQSVINEARANGAKSIISDPAGLSPEANRVWEKVRNSGVPLENITHPTGEPGYQLDFTKQSPTTAAGEAPEYHPDLQKVIDLPGVKIHTDPKQVTEAAHFVTPDGKFVRLPAGLDHDAAINTVKPDQTEYDPRINFINDTGAVRIRPATDRAGQTLHVSVPEKGVTPEQADALKQAVGAGMKSRGNMILETAATPQDIRTTDQEMVSPRHIDTMLTDIQSHPDQAKAAETPKEVAPNSDVQASAQRYAKAQGMPEINHETTPLPAKEERNTLADQYEAASHAPEHPAVKKAYDAMKSETLQQFQHAQKDLGMKYDFTEKDPYSSAAEMMKDVRDNHHLSVYSGSPVQEDHPLSEIEKTTGQPYNNLFRAVHDTYGHSAGGNDFSEGGEHSAFGAHVQMYSPEAQPAVQNETRNQTNWLFNNEGYRTGTQPWRFADQKATVLPEPPDVTKAAPQSSWAETAAKGASTSSAGAIDPKTGQSDKKGIGTEIYPEARMAFDHVPTQADFDAFNAKHAGLLAQYPELRVGWDNASNLPGGHEINLGATGPEAKRVAKKLEQRSAFDIGKGEELPTGGTGLRSSFPNYPMEERLKDLRGEPLSQVPKFEHLSQSVYDGLEPDEKDYLEGNKTLQRNVMAQYHSIAPSVNETTNAMQAGAALGGWWQRYINIFQGLADGGKEVANTIGPSHAEVLKQWHAAVSGNKSVQDANNLAWHSYADWLDAGKPTDRKAIDDIVRQNAAQPADSGKKGNAAISDTRNAKGKLITPGLDTTKLFNLVNSPEMRGERPFTGDVFRDDAKNPLMGTTEGARKIPSMGASVAGKGNLNRLVIDAHIRDFYGHQNSGGPAAQYIADSVHLRQAAKALGLKGGEGQEQLWGTVLGLKYLLKEGLTPEAAGGKLSSDIINSIGKDYAEVIANDPEITRPGGILDRLAEKYGIGRGAEGFGEAYRQASGSGPSKGGPGSSEAGTDTALLAKTAERIRGQISESKIKKPVAEVLTPAATTPAAPPEDEGDTSFNFGANVEDVHAENTAKVAEMMKAKQEAMQKGLGKGLKKK